MENKINNSLNKLTKVVMAAMTDEDKTDWENYVDGLKNLNLEERKDELKTLANDIVIYMESDIKQIKLKNLTLKNCRFYNEDGTPKEQSVI